MKGHTVISFIIAISILSNQSQDNDNLEHVDDEMDILQHHHYTTITVNFIMAQSQSAYYGCCSIFILFFVNFLSFAVGGVIIGFSVAALLELEKTSNQIEQDGAVDGFTALTFTYQWLAIAGIILGGCLVLIASVFCCAVQCRSPCCLYMVCLAYCLTVIVAVGLPIIGVVVKPKIEDRIDKFLSNSFNDIIALPKNSEHHNELCYFFEKLNSFFKCCGTDSGYVPEAHNLCGRDFCLKGDAKKGCDRYFRQYSAGFLIFLGALFAALSLIQVINVIATVIIVCCAFSKQSTKTDDDAVKLTSGSSNKGRLSSKGKLKKDSQQKSLKSEVKSKIGD